MYFRSQSTHIYDFRSIQQSSTESTDKTKETNVVHDVRSIS